MYKSILVPVDLGQSSSWQRAVPEAVAMAKSMAAKLHILTVIPDYGMPIVGSFFPADYEKSALAETDKALRAFVAANIPSELGAGSLTRHGSVYKEVVKTADALGCDLIVMASHRPENQDYLLGPNAARVARHAKQSVFIVRN